MTHCSSAGRFVLVVGIAALAAASAYAGQAQQPPASATQAQGAQAQGAQKPGVQTPAPQVPPKDVIERVLVKVNGDIITQTDLETRQGATLRMQRVNTNGMTDAQLEKLLADITPQVIVDAIDELLLLQRGHELGYKLTDDKFKEVLGNIKKENKFDTDEQLQAALKAENMTMAELRTRLEKQMIIQRVQGEEVLGRISVSEAEAKAYYEAHQGEFTTPATMMLREILIAVPTNKLGFSVGADEAAKAKADALLARLKAGDNFEKAVAEMSDAPSKGNGGLIGPIGLADIAPAMRQILEPMKVGEITNVIRTQAGYQIYKVDTRSASKILPWEEAREDIGNRVAQTKQASEFMKYMQKVRAGAVIEWKNAELKKLYDQRVALDLSGKQ